LVSSEIIVKELKQMALEDQCMEICERKGLGHPDSMCDAIMNQVSIELSKEYMKRFGTILHHNLDKGLLAAGETEVRFGGGKVLKPMLIVFGDRATFEAAGQTIPVAEIAVETAKKWIKNNLRFVDPEEHVKYQVEIKPGAVALQDIFDRKGKYLGANDTSATVGYAPKTRMENLILGLEKYINSKEFKKRYPESGEDVKIMGYRKNNDLDLTIAMAFVDRFVKDEADYFRKKDMILEDLREFTKSNIEMDHVNLALNALDKRGRGIDGCYLTVLGTSAEVGDSGQVGRGNDVIGLIPLNRPTSSEAAAGKNPVSHVGKIYNCLSYRIADEIYIKVSGIKEVYVWLLSQIGQPINLPRVATAQIALERGVKLEDISKQVQEIIESELENIDKFTVDLAYGKVTVC
jgi:S-adenosylmethionine synthetase